VQRAWRTLRGIGVVASGVIESGKSAGRAERPPKPGEFSNLPSAPVRCNWPVGGYNGKKIVKARPLSRAPNDLWLVSRELYWIENVGNLVCPSSYDLGEDMGFVLFSVTEGEDKPPNYPTIFNSADVAIITTRSDLTAAVEFDEAVARRNIQADRRGVEVFKVFAKTGEGMTEYLESFETRWIRFRAAAGVLK